MRFVLQIYSIFLAKTHFNIVVESGINDNHTNIEQLNISDNFIRRFAIISVKRNDRLFNSAPKAELVGKG